MKFSKYRYSQNLYRTTRKVRHLHYNDVIMSAMASQITSLTIVYSTVFFQVQIKENIKAPRHWPLCGEFTGDRWIPAEKTSNAENVSIWWRHHVHQNLRREPFVLALLKLVPFSPQSTFAWCCWIRQYYDVLLHFAWCKEDTLKSVTAYSDTLYSTYRISMLYKYPISRKTAVFKNCVLSNG